MRDFLTQMAERSADRAAGLRRKESEAALARRAFATPAPPLLTLSDECFDVIAEIKRRSPADGLLADGLGVARRATAYAEGGAAMISVVTEPSAFRGSLSDLEDAARAVKVPVMRKDFLVDPYQVLQARAAGAGAVLLILRLLDDTRLVEMLDAAGQAGLAVLLEAFDADDLARAAAVTPLAGRLGIPVLVGVNARDLDTLSVDTARLGALAGALPPDVPAVAESGIGSAEDAGRLAEHGYRLVLVGSALMRAPNPTGLVEDLIRAGRQGARELCA
jgi:indole-3-glycerol phosphate synthase